MKWFGLFLLFGLPLYAEDHWGTTPPVPELQISHFPAMGVIEIGWVSDSTFDRPIWYILEVKQVGEDGNPDPNAKWYRPFNPLQGTNFNERVSLNLTYRNASGAVQPWFNAEMIRIRVMWGA
tara:strand:+ start:6112 stop:6477 length:366 start_codon:yes stop_codon:yes gene_type:complete